MKKGRVIAIVGMIIVLANLVVGLIWPSYDVFNNILVCFSILSSTVMFYLLFSHSRISTFPFALAVIFGLSGLAKICFSIFSDNHWRNNLLVFLIMIITIVESMVIMAIYIFWKARKEAQNGHARVDSAS